MKSYKISRMCSIFNLTVDIEEFFHHIVDNFWSPKAHFISNPFFFNILKLLICLLMHR